LPSTSPRVRERHPFFERGGTSCVDEIELKAIMRTVGVLVLRALVPGRGLATLEDLITVTVGTEPGKAYHHLPL